ncbi:flagella assembly protein FlgT [Candidatus Colwellia aromaticivorans]|uniref:flagella assembly protein FlgT n=1 Tax=Candidatus Colwellia aromaticivorans TaxID=2267621 RepID=UPI000DF32E27|nr:flagella assembly protein FlgT [Candidatus Colwellia aromaticivorans]
MRNIPRTLALVTGLILTPLTCNAQWYEAQGHARIDQGTVEIARTKAMENALKKALLVAGASVSSIQQVVNGLLTQDQISIRASGSVNSIELIDELHSDNMISVTVRADIFPQEKKCLALDFKKSVLLTKSHLNHREQASRGSIYQLDSAVITHLNQKLHSQSTYSASKILLKSATEFSRLNASFNEEKIKQLAVSLADTTDSQYILFSEINDISFEQQRTNSWKIWQQGTYPRNFDFTLYLYSGINGELVWQNRYQNTGVWDFNKRESIDVNGTMFWQSNYGNMISALLDNMVNDIDENIMCEPSEGKILHVKGNQVVINLGRHHGVKIGDEFSLLHMSSFKNENGNHYASTNISPFKVKVVKLTKQNATAITIDHSLLGNIQLNDLAVRF